jgi:hypothetical protein
MQAVTPSEPYSTGLAAKAPPKPPRPNVQPSSSPTASSEPEKPAAAEATTSSASTAATKPHRIRPVGAPPRPSGAYSHQDVDERASDDGDDAAWANFEALMKPPSKANAEAVSSAWVVDLGSDVHEKMSVVEICELYVRGTITLGTRLKKEDGGGWEELSKVADITDALLARGVSLLPRIEAPADEEDEPEAEPSEADFAAPTRQLQADQLWAAAGIKPTSKSEEREGIHEAETAMIDSRRMLDAAGLAHLKPPSSPRPLPSVKIEDSADDAETQLYQGGAKAKSTVPIGAIRVPRVVILAAFLLLTVTIASLIFLWR